MFDEWYEKHLEEGESRQKEWDFFTVSCHEGQTAVEEERIAAEDIGGWVDLKVRCF
jgi:hypothetical protein